MPLQSLEQNLIQSLPSPLIPPSRGAKSGATPSTAAASEALNLQASQQPLELLYRSALAKLNEILAPELGPQAIEQAAKQDFTPEATAERIVGFATGFFGGFLENHPEMEQDSALNEFLELIGGGIEQGFAEARGILEGLEILNGEIEQNVNKTYELVQQGLERFRLAIMEQLGLSESEDATPA
ncbi:DUF5610 domain-containing protein [Candidatus Endoriftia persephonae]|jgi:hypothetical protein|uniref:DUF5610 domain-containing protein n=2 Tax=Gammaproteobacteria TaxID=1236 RepID=G2FGA0_9GAMM|nr:DUF5610 domain-containing protein [Candidatus Endoriftia persephone]EGW54173.1 hypothetical protein TevJSym_ap00400 [endosymbiont of Tevnia jerichonana (vent Tica)]USF88612.1 DUF5610 domain-containing protein [Candidatus Endoriftia persephone]